MATPVADIVAGLDPALKEQLREAAQTFLNAKNFAALTKLIAKYPVAGRLQLENGTSIYGYAWQHACVSLILQASRAGEDFKGPLVEGSPQSGAVDILVRDCLHKHSTERLVDVHMLLEDGVAPCASSSYAAIRQLEGSVSGFPLPPGALLRSALSKFPPDTETGHALFGQIMVEPAYCMQRLSEQGRQQFDELASLCSLSADFDATQDIGLLNKAIGAHSYDAAECLVGLGFKALGPFGTPVSPVQLAKDCSWSAEVIAQLETALVLQKVAGADEAFAQAASVEGAEEGEAAVDAPKSAIRRRQFF